MIGFSLPAPPGEDKIDLHLEIFDLLGQRVISLLQGPHPAGTHRVHWNGRDPSGVPLASGVYLARLTTASGEDLSCRMVLMK